jgi:membrane peptidoglycan carboxypeptidase
VARRAAQTIDPRAPGYPQGGGYGGGGHGGGGGYGPSGRPLPPRRPGRFRVVDYPRYGRRGWKRWVPSWKLVLTLLLLGILSVITVLVAAYAATSVPQKDALASAQSSVVYWKNGKTLAAFPGPNRRSVPLKQVPQSLQYAVLSAEDRSFYSNNGVSLRGTVRAALNDVRGRSLQGGSTITQQYVKNYFDLRDRTLARKAKEFFIALKINKETPKAKILEEYLNTIYMGRNAYGMQAAAGVYFNTPVEKLNVSQAAYLAGIINGPELYDPYDRERPDALARATERWNYVLDGMVAQGWLKAGDRTGLQFPKIVPPKTSNTRAGQVGYIMDMVKAELATKLGWTDKQLETGGYRINLTLDPEMMKRAADAAAEAPTLSKKQNAKGVLQTAVVSVDPKTGAVVAFYGGKDYLERQRNAATQDEAQAGSTFKIFTLLAALQWGDENGPLSLHSRFDGSSPMLVTEPGGNGGKEFVNFGPGRGEQFGNIDLVRATEHSVNTVFAQLNKRITPQKTVEAARAAGIPKSVKISDTVGNVLGDASPHPIDMASAYATIANGGFYRKPYVVASIVNLGDRKAVYLAKKPSTSKRDRAFDEGVTADATYAMQQVVEHGTAAGNLSDFNRPAAGKTGTSSSNNSAWFVGFTPQLSTAVAMYRLDPKTGGPIPLKDIGGRSEVTGGGFPAIVWEAFMKDALKGQDKLTFPDPVFGGDTFNPAPKFTPRPTSTGTPTGTPTGSPTGTPTGTPTGPPTGSGSPTGSGTPTGTRTRTGKPTVPGIPNPPAP